MGDIFFVQVDKAQGVSPHLRSAGFIVGGCRMQPGWFPVRLRRSQMSSAWLRIGSRRMRKAIRMVSGSSSTITGKYPHRYGVTAAGRGKIPGPFPVRFQKRQAAVRVNAGTSFGGKRSALLFQVAQKK